MEHSSNKLLNELSDIVRAVLGDDKVNFSDLAMLRLHLYDFVAELQATTGRAKELMESIDTKISDMMEQSGGLKTINVDGVGKFTKVNSKAYSTGDLSAFIEFLERERKKAEESGIPLEVVYTWLGKNVSSSRVSEYFADTGTLPDGVVSVDRQYIRFTRQAQG